MNADSLPDPENLRIFIENRGRFLGFLRRHVGNEAEAEDLLQHALLKAIRRQEQWDGKDDVLAWFYRILRNALIDHYRSRAADRRKAETLERQSPPLPEDRDGLCACFEALLPSLKPEYAEALRRVDLGEEEPAGVAEALGISPNNLGVRLHRARQALRKSLEATCGVCSRHGCLDCACDRQGGSPT
jgi:RNA polymerase sigma-70 factor (ECF subfamily)